MGHRGGAWGGRVRGQEGWQGQQLPVSGDNPGEGTNETRQPDPPGVASWSLSSEH